MPRRSGVLETTRGWISESSPSGNVLPFILPAALAVDEASQSSDATGALACADSEGNELISGTLGNWCRACRIG